jgi:hypothetical protein
MRTGTTVKAMLLLLAAGSAAVFGRGPAATAPDSPRPILGSTQPAPLPGDAFAPREELPRPGVGDISPAGPVGQQGANDASSCPAPQKRCGHCGCRRSAECGQVPFGAALNAHLNAQICNGLAARMVLYHYDFCDAAGADAGQLNEHGMARLADIARMFPRSCFHPILIERSSCNAALDAARREYVVRMLGQMNASVPDALVVVGKPATPGLSGQEAVLLHKNLIEQTKAAATAASAAGGGVLGGASSGSGQTSGGSSGSTGH